MSGTEGWPIIYFAGLIVMGFIIVIKGEKENNIPLGLQFSEIFAAFIKSVIVSIVLTFVILGIHSETDFISISKDALAFLAWSFSYLVFWIAFKIFIVP